MGRGKWAVVLAVLVWTLAATAMASACEDYPANRADAAYFLAVAVAGGNASVPAFTGTPSFSDVPADYWAFKYVEYCVANGVVKGQPDGTYGPDDLVNRAEMSMFIACAIATPTYGVDLVNYTPPATATFPDVPTDYWAYKYVEYLYEQGVDIAYQTSPLLFRPEDIASAFTFASWIDQAFRGIGIADPCTPPHPQLHADFTANPTSGTPPLIVQFEKLSTGYSTWLWDFGDGSTSTDQNPAHTYAALGWYTVSLTVSANWGSSSTSTQVDFIFVHNAPTSAESVVVELQVTGFGGVVSISVNPADGSFWVADAKNSQVVHLSSSGAVLGGSSSIKGPMSVSVNSTDGSCWVGHGSVAHLAEDGAVLWDGSFGSSVSVNPTDGSCWVTNNSQVVHLSAAGVELWRSGSSVYFVPVSVAADPIDGSCYIANTAGSQVVRVSANGTLLPGGAFITLSPQGISGASVSVDSTDGSAWVCYSGGGAYGYDMGGVFHFSADGGGLGGVGFATFQPLFITANSVDGSCWVSGKGNGTLHVSSDGAILWSDWAIGGPVSVNSTDGSCWVSNANGTQVLHLVVLVDFSDVPYNYWAFHQIDACYTAGIVTGYSDGTYKPTDPVTRDQMAVYISRALAKGDAYVPTGPATATFSDVPIDYWAFRYVEYAVTQNVVKGYSDGTYKPTDQVDRGQMAVFIARSIVTPTGDAGLARYTPPILPYFPDVPTTFWAYKYVEYIAQPSIAITQGYPDGLYHPEYICTRDQMAVYVARAFKLPA